VQVIAGIPPTSSAEFAVDRSAACDIATRLGAPE
jgi:hypothetical protein